MEPNVGRCLAPGTDLSRGDDLPPQIERVLTTLHAEPVAFDRYFARVEDHVDRKRLGGCGLSDGEGLRGRLGPTFEDAGEHELKSVPERWRLYRVVAG